MEFTTANMGLTKWHVGEMILRYEKLINNN